jgi:hypothetical protein
MITNLIALSTRKSAHFWRDLLLILRLRYKLTWAEVRTSRGRKAIRSGLSVLGFVGSCFVLLGGVAAGSAAAASGDTEQYAGWILSGIAVTALMLTITFGSGARRVLADRNLRLLPLSGFGRFAARHATALMDPIWLFTGAAVTGVAVGSSFRQNPFAANVAVATLYVAETYVAVMLAIELAEAVTGVRAGAAAVSALAICGLILISIIAPSIPVHGWPGFPSDTGNCVRYFPPGLTAHLMAGPDRRSAFSSVMMLAAWLVILTACLYLQQHRGVRTVRCRRLCWNSPYDRVAALFGRALSPHVGKTLRYLLRCNRVRFNLAVSVPLIVIMPQLMTGNDTEAARVLLTAALFCLGPMFATNSIALNQFGCDGDGMRRYFFLPTPCSTLILGACAADFLLGTVVILLGAGLWAIVQPAALDVRAVLMLLSSGATGLFLFGALSIWTSTLEPQSIDFHGFLGNPLSLAGNVVMMTGISGSFGAAFVLSRYYGSETVLSCWWILLPACVGAVFFFFLSVHLAGNALSRNREAFARRLGGASG